VVCWSDAHRSDTCDCRWEGNRDFRLGVWEILSTEWRLGGQSFGRLGVYRRDAPEAQSAASCPNGYIVVCKLPFSFRSERSVVGIGEAKVCTVKTLGAVGQY
jgi:hypothetical protein